MLAASHESLPQLSDLHDRRSPAPALDVLPLDAAVAQAALTRQESRRSDVTSVVDSAYATPSRTVSRTSSSKRRRAGKTPPCG